MKVWVLSYLGSDGHYHVHSVFDSKEKAEERGNKIYQHTQWFIGEFDVE